MKFKVRVSALVRRPVEKTFVIHARDKKEAMVKAERQFDRNLEMSKMSYERVSGVHIHSVVKAELGG